MKTIFTIFIGDRALPSRRTYIPKADGRQRPLGIAALEDKIVQAAVVMILTPIYEAEILGFSYGFRPGRSQHDALDALAYGIKASVGVVVEVWFHEWLQERPDIGIEYPADASPRRRP